MSDDNDITFEEGFETPASKAIDVQLDVINYVNEMDHSGLYDEWNEQKIKVLSRAMKIILKAQDLMLKELK